MRKQPKRVNTKLDELARELTAVIDEDVNGHAWTGKAKELADKVRKIIEAD